MWRFILEAPGQSKQHSKQTYQHLTSNSKADGAEKYLIVVNLTHDVQYTSYFAFRKRKEKEGTFNLTLIHHFATLNTGGHPCLFSVRSQTVIVAVLVWLLRVNTAASQMCLKMFLHVTGVAETFPTVAAAKRFFSCVIAQVHRQVSRLAEAFPAHRAAVRLLPRVHPAVFLVIACVPEGATTKRAAVVFSHVPLWSS